MSKKVASNKQIKKEEVNETTTEVLEKEEVVKDIPVTNDLEGVKPGPDAGVEAPKVDSPKFLDGQVFGVSRLRLRERPLDNEKSGVVMLMKKGTVVKINVLESTETFYKVQTGESARKFAGYCLKKYIQVSE